MTVILVVLVVGTAFGLVVALVVSRWPKVDPASPKATAHAVGQQVARHPALREFLRRRTDPATATGLTLSALLVVAGGGIVATGLMFGMVETDSGFARWDRSAASWGAAHGTAVSTTFLRNVSQLGGTIGTVALSVVVAAVVVARTRRWSVVGFLATVLIGIALIVNVTKHVVSRPRPDIRQLTGFSGASFPSGHAATSAATFAALALVLGVGASLRVKAVLAGSAAGIAAAVATTRVLLGVHWLTDVMAGVGVGWAWSAIVSVAFGGRLLRFGAPVEVAERAAAVGEAAAPTRR